MSRLAAERVKVVLTGEGSDETLAGYGRYRTTLYNLALGEAWEALGGSRVRVATRALIDAVPGPRLRNRLARTFLYLAADLPTLYFDNFAVFSRAQQKQLLSTTARRSLEGVDPYATIRDYMRQSDAGTILDRLLYADTKTYLHELLMKQDQMSMAASIESRVPFLDHPLIEFAARLPQRMKLRGLTTKYILRRAMQGILPERILTRRKMGFPVPVGRWLAREYRHLLDEYVTGPRAINRGLFDPAYVRGLIAEHEGGQANHAERLWALLNTEIWQRIFLDDEPVSDVASGMATLVRRAPGVSPVAAPPALSPLPLTRSQT